jgi:hypothetical protein
MYLIFFFLVIICIVLYVSFNTRRKFNFGRYIRRR